LNNGKINHYGTLKATIWRTVILKPNGLQNRITDAFTPYEFHDVIAGRRKSNPQSL
jgi:hypothetical protein